MSTFVEGLTEARLWSLWSLPQLHSGSCKVTRQSKIWSCQVTTVENRIQLLSLQNLRVHGESFYCWFGKNSTRPLPTSSNPARDVIRHLATRNCKVQNCISKYSMNKRGKGNHNQLQPTHPDLNKNPGGSKAETESCHNLNISLKREIRPSAYSM